MLRIASTTILCLGRYDSTNEYYLRSGFRFNNWSSTQHSPTGS